jgi:hypothetical protein
MGKRRFLTPLVLATTIALSGGTAQGAKKPASPAQPSVETQEAVSSPALHAPMAQAPLEAVLREETHGTPFALIERNVLETAYKDYQRASQNHDVKAARQIEKKILDSLVPFDGDEKGRQHVREMLEQKRLDLARLLNAGKPDLDNSGPCAVPMLDKGGNRLAVMVVDNVRDLRSDSGFAHSAFERMTGIKGLDAALGPAAAKNAALFILLHEATHIGDPTVYPSRDGTPANRTALCEGENRADRTAGGNLGRAGGDPAFTTLWLHARAVNTLRNDDAEHATQFSMTPKMAKDAPALAQAANLTPERTLAALKKIKEATAATGVPFPDDTSGPGVEAARDAFLRRAVALYDRGDIKDPDARTLIACAKEGFTVLAKYKGTNKPSLDDLAPDASKIKAPAAVSVSPLTSFGGFSP